MRPLSFKALAHRGPKNGGQIKKVSKKVRRAREYIFCTPHSVSSVSSVSSVRRFAYQDGATSAVRLGKSHGQQIQQNPRVTEKLANDKSPTAHRGAKNGGQIKKVSKKVRRAREYIFCTPHSVSSVSSVRRFAYQDGATSAVRLGKSHGQQIQQNPRVTEKLANDKSPTAHRGAKNGGQIKKVSKKVRRAREYIICTPHFDLLTRFACSVHISTHTTNGESMKMLHDRLSPDERRPIDAGQLIEGGGRIRPLNRNIRELPAVRGDTDQRIQTELNAQCLEDHYVSIGDAQTASTAKIVEDFARGKCRTESEMRLVLTAILLRLATRF